MELVEAGEDDVEALAAWWFALASEMERYAALNELAVEEPSDAESGFERQLDRDDTAVFMLDVDGERVGYVTVRDGERPSRAQSHYAEVVDLFVEPEHRGQGHGSDAIEAVKRHAREREAAYVTVSCEWHNEDARRFYESNGFTEKQVTYVHRVDD